MPRTRSACKGFLAVHAERERAAYLLSESLGCGFVPPTVIREDGPLAPLQCFVQSDFQQHYFT